MKYLKSTIMHDLQHQMFSKRVKGGMAYVKYNKPEEDLIEIRHTFVPKEARHKGVASNLVNYTLDFAQSEGIEVIPTCPFVKDYIDHHDEYKKLVHD